MILLECSPPFQRRPSFFSNGHTRRFMWGWFAIAYVPDDFNGFVRGMGDAAVRLYREGNYPAAPTPPEGDGG